MRHLGRPVVRATILGVLALVLTGMGGLGGSREEAPARDFRATSEASRGVLVLL